MDRFCQLTPGLPPEKAHTALMAVLEDNAGLLADLDGCAPVMHAAVCICPCNLVVVGASLSRRAPFSEQRPRQSGGHVCCPHAVLLQQTQLWRAGVGAIRRL